MKSRSRHGNAPSAVRLAPARNSPSWNVSSGPSAPGSAAVTRHTRTGSTTKTKSRSAMRLIGVWRRRAQATHASARPVKTTASHSGNQGKSWILPSEATTVLCRLGDGVRPPTVKWRGLRSQGRADPSTEYPGPSSPMPTRKGTKGRRLRASLAGKPRRAGAQPPWRRSAVRP